jgi:hypothetical protein
MNPFIKYNVQLRLMLWPWTSKRIHSLVGVDAHANPYKITPIKLSSISHRPDPQKTPQTQYKNFNF